MSVSLTRKIGAAAILIIPVVGSACWIAPAQVASEATSPGGVHQVDHPVAVTTATGICLDPANGKAHHLHVSNEVAKNDMPHNALTESALLSDPAVLAKLMGNPLSSAVVSTIATSVFQLEVPQLPHGQVSPVQTVSATIPSLSDVLMKYIVSCAMDSETSIHYKAPDSALTLSWDGEIGLCSKGSSAGDWNADRPTPACLELVSACLLARVNAVGRRVPLSLRGEPDCLFPRRDKVVVEKHYTNDAMANSFTACSGAQGGRGHNACGWDQGFIGRCKTGTPVKVAVKVANPSAKVCSSAAVRVCSGIYGCDNPGLANKEPATPIPSQKLGNSTLDTFSPRFVDESAGGCDAASSVFTAPAITFTCPANGPYINGDQSQGSYGYYGLMTSAIDASNLDFTGSDPGNVYPAREEDIFTYREGAFYGNVFDSGNAKNRPALPDARNNAYACFSDIWTSGATHLTSRMCAGDDGACFIHQPGPCHDFSKIDNSYRRCTSEHPSAGDYDDCSGETKASRTWAYPITVFLHEPCDLSDGTLSHCGVNLATPPHLTLPGRDTDPTLPSTGHAQAPIGTIPR